MANEITLTASLSLAKTGQNLTGSVSGLSITQSGSTNIANVQTVGTTSEQLSLGDVSSPGYLFLKNLDATNFVVFDLNNPAVASTAFCTLLPGEGAVIPTRRTAIYAKADTASCNVFVEMLSL
ncbi:MAG: hypothetical protein EB141_13335 [Verrucomicrobia bacterium]|nr:hypothetical protein [Verrucomicrobiota bacterium]NDB76602.1 hypothetical protein [Verrucomicrobiota bacterium]